MTTKINFKVFETIALAWSKVKGAKSIFWTIVFFTFSVSILHVFLKNLEKMATTNETMLIFYLLALLTFLLRQMLVCGLLYIGAERAAGATIKYNMLREVFTLGVFIKIVGYYLLLGLLLLPGLIVFGYMRILHHMTPLAEIISSHPITLIFSMALSISYILFIQIRLYIGSIIVLVEKAAPWTAIKQSFQATQANFWKLFGLVILNIFIFVLSIIPFGIGLIWTMPYFFINKGVVYRTLRLYTHRSSNAG